MADIKEVLIKLNFIIQNGMWRKLLVDCLSGATSTLIITPLDTIRIRLNFFDELDILINWNKRKMSHFHSLLKIRIKLG